MSKEEFFRQSQAAVERMREMNMRSAVPSEKHKMPPAPAFVRLNNNGKKTQQQAYEQAEEKAIPQTPVQSIKMQSASGTGIPFLDILKKDSDITVIIGLLLLLLSENSDKTLLLALLYILM